MTLLKPRIGTQYASIRPFCAAGAAYNGTEAHSTHEKAISRNSLPEVFDAAQEEKNLFLCSIPPRLKVSLSVAVTCSSTLY